jgi:HAD superfamily hydrolase (TIGR01458 family)
VRASSAGAGLSAILVDLEGTVYQAGRLLPGAARALSEAEARGVPHRFVTNTTRRPRSAIVRELSKMGLEVDPGSVFTAPLAARRYLLDRGFSRCHLLGREALAEDLAGLELVDSPADAVLLGDLGDELTFERLNRAFRAVVAGAALVTMARNRYWRDADGLVIDVGALAAALEFASGRPATLVGKPSADFFAGALASLGVPASAAAVVGDDLESDVGGAQAAGMRGILVRTGKFRPEELAAAGSVRPDAVIDSLADLPDLLL